MFGLLYGLFCAGVAAFNGIKHTCEDVKSFKETKDEKTGTYYDRDCHTRLISNGDRAMFMRDPVTNDSVLYSLKEHKVVRNFSEEKRQEKLKQIKADGSATVVKWDEHYGTLSRKDGCWGHRYYDVTSDKFVVMRRIKLYDYYMDMDTGMLIRPSDEWVNIIKTSVNPHTEKNIYTEMEKYNTRKRDIPKSETWRYYGNSFCIW